MYLPVPPQPDCISAWREALRAVENQPGHVAYNVIIDVDDPVANTSPRNPRIVLVDDFLTTRQKKPLRTVANTIFPESLYHRYRAPDFFEVFRRDVLSRVRRNDRWSGYYFERMIDVPVPPGQEPNQLWEIVQRIRDERVRSLSKFELSLFDAGRDVDNSPYGGQCLSFLSFKIVPTHERTLALTALYRNHFYIEKLLGNLIGLGRLMAFVARETGLRIGPLTIVSTRAEVDVPTGTSRRDIANLLARLDQAESAFAS